MFRVTYYLGESGTLPTGKILCETSRSLAEIDVQWNHSRMIQIDQLATTLGSGVGSYGRDFANWRNVLGLTVRREKSLASATFADAEAAMLFMLDHPADFPGAGTLKLELTGGTTSATRYLLNAMVQDIQMVEWLGIAPAIRYTFSCGLISASSPFSA